ncbi:MAG: hypothetical protein KGH61_02795 [Candidatus Micrarchaeota archaeon]|nr:hypothetical protein [Candidatus Micrarchaeota archaeon]MDE1847852.1 hypothetical protein [Candidatus Micrarchaeota archaeon]MDE1864179.1 hypothetical protein [Candidatus Micrarchaeota archaeon]
MGNSLKAKVVEEKPGQIVFLHFKVVEDKYGAFLLRDPIGGRGLQGG